MNRIAWSHFIEDQPLDRESFAKLAERRDTIQSQINAILDAAELLIDPDCED
jgi:hypothetical protein